ncbi:hypothetical protein [Candidatus Atelocyanobacterium thalassae]|uniref:Glycosyltransferase RgtA/B/C/D-like domain-containing protein n=1 Tax=cyanobacterium endosymbiont of Braarudosphaera bigelowii TaxID=1285375 RepID=A0ABN6K0G6_9CHRO|nr:hypothetical protein [Candidatus Atelocyanobacterium thalassa]BDA40228.1 hypothetical protein CPARK_000106600 [cyanobacterium endosymbiont of Braarudosphaera bigelowii]
MYSKNFKLEKFSSQILFASLIIIYYLIGFYLIQKTSITSDESAYIGAAYSYIQGLGLNWEHPLLLKLIDSVIFNLFFSNHEALIPTINLINGQENIEARLAAFNVGYELLTKDSEAFHRIVFSLRFVHLFFNSFIFIWFYLYTFIFNEIDSIISIIFLILYIFSPSFYSHNFLIAFDVSVSLYALLFILSFSFLVKSLVQGKNKYLAAYFTLFTLLLFIAINVKFSNLILIPIIGLVYIVYSIYLLIKKRKQKFLQITFLGSLSLLLQVVLTVSIYSLAFRNLPNKSLSNILNIYIQGIGMNLSTAKGIREPFLNGQFISTTAINYLLKIFWFKENLILLIIAIFLFLVCTKKILFVQYPIQKILKSYLNKKILLVVSIVSMYPVIYLWISSSSRFVIGYRYFYPIIIFVYLLFSTLLVTFSYKWKKYILLGLMTSYIYLGITGISQSLSYVNPLWNKEKWQLADDSTVNWGQETQHVVEYLIQNRLLTENNENTLVYQLFGVNIGFVQYLELLSKNYKYPINIQSYYQPILDLKNKEITKLPYKYLLIDSTVKQQIYVEKNNNLAASQNWDFLIKRKPIYSRNNIIYIYQIK